MLKTALVALTIVGCDCDAKLCEFVRETPQHYASLAECEAAIVHEAVATGVTYPLVTGICRSAPDASQPQIQLAGATPGQAIGTGTRVERRTLLARTTDGYAVVRRSLGSVVEGTAGLARRATGSLVSLARF